jgi:hypothetical protein
MNNVWVIRNIRNDWDYKLLDDGKTYFEGQGFKHLDMKAFEPGYAQALFTNVADALPKPASEAPAPKPYSVKIGDLTLDSDLLDKYIKSILDEEKGLAVEEETKKKIEVVRIIEKRFSVREEDDEGPLSKVGAKGSSCPV